MTMILGIDIGNYATKDNFGNNFKSKVSCIPDTLGNKYCITLAGENYYLGTGEFDTEYRKINKKSYLKLLYGIMSLSSKEEVNDIDLALGLPIGQYHKDKESLRKLIIENQYMSGCFNNKKKTFIISNVTVCLEGLAAVPKNFEGIIIDIGGRTTDAGVIYYEHSDRKVESALSLPVGTLNLYSDFIKTINNIHGLDLKLKDSERIIRKGLEIEGKVVDLRNEMNIFREYLDDLVSNLNIQYSLKTNKVACTGGGSIVFKSALKKRIPHIILSNNPRFDNVIGFYRKGVELWDENTSKL